MDYKMYEKITFSFMGLTYICLLFNVTIFFENFLASIFSLIATITCRIYYIKKLNILCHICPKSELVTGEMDKCIGMSFVGPIMLGGPAVFFLVSGLLDI